MGENVYKSRRTHSEAGFSFIDVMLALVILTIGVLALADLQAVTLKRGISSQRLISAITMAEQKMETIKKATYANIVAEPSTQVTASGLTYNRQVTFFFFQAEDGIRDLIVTGVQTCALPI